MLLEFDDQKKDIFNSLGRIQNLMSLDVTYINKREELKKRLHNMDLQSSADMLAKVKADEAAANEEMPEDKGTLVNIPVVIKGVEVISYVMRMGQSMPTFNYWPRGREIIHRLILKSAMTDNLDDLKLKRTKEEVINGLVFQRLEDDRKRKIIEEAEAEAEALV